MRLPRFAPHVAVLAGLTVASSATDAEASTHRFAPTDEVVVSLELRKPRLTGTFVSFGRNRVALSRTRSGGLELRVKGSKSRRVARSVRRSMRVSLALSVRTGSAKLVAGGRTASLPGRFVAEDAVAVRTGRTIRVLKIRTGAVAERAVAPGSSSPKLSSPVPTSALTSGAAAPTSAPALLPAGRLFAADSVWNAPLAASAALDPAGAVLVKTLRDTATQNMAASWGPWIERSGTSPLYVVPASQPSVRVQLDPGSWKLGLQKTFEAVPIPPNAVPAAGLDAHMAVFQPSTDRMWEFFKARKLADGWHAAVGGSMSSVSRSPGYYNTDSWPGLSQSWWGATASSLPVIAGTIMISELRAGVIPHALALNIPYAKPSVYSWPAQRTDGRSTDPNAIPEGAHFRLDPTLDIDALNLPPMTRMMAKAAQRYGMIVRDQTGHAISFFTENPSQSVTDPYSGPGGFYGGLNPGQLTARFPWDRAQLVKMTLHP